ncbi:glycosyltransferase [Desulfurobacterium sp.]
MIKVDLHLHSRASNKPAGFLSKKLNICESYSEPLKLYEKLKSRGMTLFTLTDHDSIAGCLEIAHLPNTFISEEITTKFPEDGCKVHVLAIDITEKIHEEIQYVRNNIYDLVDFLNGNNVTFILAHPLYDMDGKLSPHHIEKFLLMFDNWEIFNGTRSRLSANLTEKLATSFNWQKIEELANKYGFLKRKRKRIAFTGGSDDHGGLEAGNTYTFVKSGTTVEDLKQAIDECRTVPSGNHGSPQKLTHTVMNIAFQGAARNFNLGNIKEIISELLTEEKRKYSIKLFIKSAKREQFLKKVIGQEYDNVKKDVHQRIYKFVNSIVPYSINNLIERGTDFETLTSSVGLITLSLLPLATYATTYWQRALEKRKSADLYFELTGKEHIEGKVAIFTDTFFEINGVARTYQKIADIAREENFNLQILLSENTKHPEDEYIKIFKPIISFPLPEYEELHINIPNFLEVLDYVERENFDVIYAATPGVLGLTALAISKILALPFVSTFHTDIPEYVYKYTNDHLTKGVTWKLLSTFYNSCDRVLSPSFHYKKILIKQGVKAEKIRVFKRGIDLERFNPAYKDKNFWKRFDRNYNGEKVILYVGRVSKEKEIDTFISVAKSMKNRKELKFVIVGDGPYRKEAESKAENVLFTGYLEGKDLSTAYASSFLFLFPSTTETFGNVILEAYASGLPVIVSNKGASGENVIDGETGFIVNNSPKAYIEKIEILLENPELYKAIKSNALNYVKQMDHKALLIKMLNLISFGRLKKLEKEAIL